MPIDDVSRKRALLEIASREGSINAVDTFRAELEKFQNRYRENKPSIIDVSTDAEKLFREDIEVISALGSLTADREVKRLCMALVRALMFLAKRPQGD